MHKKEGLALKTFFFLMLFFLFECPHPVLEVIHHELQVPSPVINTTSKDQHSQDTDRNKNYAADKKEHPGPQRVNQYNPDSGHHEPEIHPAAEILKHMLLIFNFSPVSLFKLFSCHLTFSSLIAQSRIEETGKNADKGNYNKQKHDLDW